MNNGPTSPQPVEVLLLDPEHAARVLGVSDRMLRRLTAERRLGFVKVGRHVRFELSELMAYVERHRWEATR